MAAAEAHRLPDQDLVIGLPGSSPGCLLNIQMHSPMRCGRFAELGPTAERLRGRNQMPCHRDCSQDDIHPIETIVGPVR